MSTEQIKAIDDEYMSAVENGDMETAQRLVNEAAERAGYTTDNSYRLGHQAPTAQIKKADFTNLDKLRELLDEGWDLNLYAISNGISNVPSDFFSSKGATWYNYDDADGMESYRAIKRVMSSIQQQVQRYGEVRKMPTIKIYRAMPKALKESKMQSGGQWVTPSYMYAVRHGESVLNGDYKIIEETVSAENLWWDANDIREWGFDDGTTYAYRDTKNNRKLLDAVTYDEGNVIPLSKRFNYRNADERFSREASHHLQEENERLHKELQDIKRKYREKQKQKDYWKDEATRAPILDRDDVKSVTENLLSSYSSKADKTATFNAVKKLGEFIIRGGDRTADLEWSVVKEKAVDIARNILENASELADDGNRATYKEIRNYLRTTKLHITQSLKNEIGYLSDDFNTFRKRNMGRLSLSFAEGIGIDTAYQELLFNLNLTLQSSYILGIKACF